MKIKGRAFEYIHDMDTRHMSLSAHLGHAGHGSYMKVWNAVDDDA